MRRPPLTSSESIQPYPAARSMSLRSLPAEEPWKMTDGSKVPIPVRFLDRTPMIVLPRRNYNERGLSGTMYSLAEGTVAEEVDGSG